ncbi:MAG: thioredoxin domain-containing protein [Acidobacteria bacterium]|nr:thioredoxin domain-containing protein [Acidobacteriota bacterium]
MSRRDRAAKVKSRACLSALVLVLAACADTEGTGPGAGAEANPGPSGGDTSSLSVTLPLPGTPLFGPELLKSLDLARKTKGPAYKPHTRHLRPDGWAKYTNRLFLESSPYLLQHAHNPVNWYSWGDEVFAEAKRRGVPILLSVGYSTCHWCHVMEEESFEDEEIARIMNESYVAIKVDREERPDVDAIYMSAVQAMTAQGGWPMTVWLTPDRKPFFGGTYFPARDGDRGGGTGFLTLLRKLKEAYDAQPDRVAASATEITRHVQGQLATQVGGTHLPGVEIVRAAAAQYRSRFDATNGGVAGAPKFPSSLAFPFLLRYHRRTRDPESLHMAVLTLEKMAAGGMYDQIGGGFHRYSTDVRWLVPHFEKMLYDNALLTLAYLDAYQTTGDAGLARVAREILRYVERDMTSRDGAFYSSTDADSLTPEGHREEGYFFTWTPAEIEAALGQERARMLEAYYGVTPGGNFEGRSILHVARPLAEVARELKIKPEELSSTLEQAREILYRERARRPAPLRDEKVLVAWNGLMISGYARAAMVFGEERYAGIAGRAADFLLRNLLQDGRLRRSFKDGRAWHNAYLDDYAFFIASLLDLFEATGEARWLEEAIALDHVLEAHYEDKTGGGFFMTSDDHEVLLAREKPSYDGAEPSGNSVAVLNLLRLHELTTLDSYRQRAERTFKAFSPLLARAPQALSEMLLAVDFHLDTPKEIVIVVPEKRSDAEPLLAQLRASFVPNRVLVVAVEGKELQRLSELVPLLEAKVAQRGKATAYVCERRVCELPTSDPAVFAKQIRKVRSLDESGTNPDR